MARHSTTGLHSKSMALSTYSPARYELDTYRARSAIAAPSRNNQQQLPSFQELVRSVGCNVGNWGVFNGSYQGQTQRRDSVQSLQPEISQPVAPEVQPKVLSYAPSVADSYERCTADSGQYDRPLMSDTSPEDSAGANITWFDRAKTARDTINRQFAHESVSTLQKIRLEVDPKRPAFGLDSKPTQQLARATRGSKHSEAERDRRAAHAVAQTQQAKRFPNAIFELTTYETGNRKPPGKHHIFVAALLMYEFDTLLVAKQQEEIAILHRQLREHEREPATSPSRHWQPSCAKEYSSNTESLRKRKRHEESTDTAPYSSLHLPYRCESRSNGSRHYYSNSDPAHYCDISDHGFQQDGLHSRTAPRHYRRQTPLPISPAPTSSGFEPLTYQHDDPWACFSSISVLV